MAREEDEKRGTENKIRNRLTGKFLAKYNKFSNDMKQPLLISVEGSFHCQPISFHCSNIKQLSSFSGKAATFFFNL